MKINDREMNSFQGSYIGYHDEMDAKQAPLYFKLLFALVFLVVFGGVGVSFYMFSLGYIDLFVIAILSILIIEFPLIHLLMVLFDKIKYGKVRKQAKIVGSIFSSISIFLLTGVILSRFMNFFIILFVGIVIIFYAIGIGICIAGTMQFKREKNNCTLSVWALCKGYESLNPHLTILDNPDYTYGQNDVVARTQVSRPIWEFEYNGQIIHVSPEHYEGKLRINEGKQYKIFINPQNPQEIYCEQNSNAKYLINMGKIWLVFMTCIFLLVGFIMWMIF